MITKARVKRVAVIGTGARAGDFLQALATMVRDNALIVGLGDPNPTRLEYYQRRLVADWHYPHTVPTFDAEHFDEMIRQARPDAVLICTPDRFHAEYTCRVLEAGCDVIVEKPLAIDAAGCNQIIETARRTGRNVRVAFNCRFMPTTMLVKQLLTAGVIGEVISGSLDYMIGAAHGATYFARWHSQKKQSGGLLVHKASHHFDMLNWWLDAIPETVFAVGRRGFFGADNQHKHGITNAAMHYLDEAVGSDPFRSTFTTSPLYRDLYLDGAGHDGYRADRSVWRGDEMDIEDAVALTLRYRSGQIFNYSLNAFSPFAGCHAVFHGVKGRLEMRTEFDAHLEPVEPGPPPASAQKVTLRDRCVVYPLYGQPYEVTIPTAEGSHDGSDPLMIKQMFGTNPAADTFGRHAGPEQGAASALIGIAANQSLLTGQAVAITELTAAFKDGLRLSDLE